MTTQRERRHAPDIAPINNLSGIDRFLEEAIKTAPFHKATGSDELFVESMQLSPAKISKLLSTMWKKCGNLKYIIKDWNKA